MTISGKLRGENFRIPEHKATQEPSYEAELIQRISSIIAEKRAQTVGSGRSADVILLNIWPDKGDLKPWVVKQENRLTKEQEALGTSLTTELMAQDRAYSIVATTRAKNPELPLAKIPQPLSVLEHDSKHWMVMEYIPGETLFERALKVFLHNLNEDGDAQLNPETISHMRRDELIDTISEDEYRNLLPPRLVEDMNERGVEIGEEHFFFIANMANRYTKGPGKILTPLQFDKLNNTIQTLHKNGLWHRDLHPSNVQIMPDGDIAILDFGLSLQAERGTVPENGIYNVDLGDNFRQKSIQLPSDERMLETYQKIARKIK